PRSVGVFLIFRGLEECHRKDPLDEHEERGEERKLSEGREREKEMASLRRSSRRYTRENVLADQVRLKQSILAPPTWHTISVPPQMPHPSHFDEEWNGRTTRLELATPVSKETDDECRFDGGSS
ncbi:hypothetical protein V1478_001015, partial [Vespula squamosa]